MRTKNLPVVTRMEICAIKLGLKTLPNLQNQGRSSQLRMSRVCVTIGARPISLGAKRPAVGFLQLACTPPPVISTEHVLHGDSRNIDVEIQ